MGWCFLDFNMKLEAVHLCGFWKCFTAQGVRLMAIQWPGFSCTSGCVFSAFITNSLMNPIWMVKTRMQLERKWVTDGGNGSLWVATGASGKLNHCGFTHGSLCFDRSCPVFPWLSVPPFKPCFCVVRLKVHVLCVLFRFDAQKLLRRMWELPWVLG